MKKKMNDEIAKVNGIEMRCGCDAEQNVNKNFVLCDEIHDNELKSLQIK